MKKRVAWVFDRGAIEGKFAVTAGKVTGTSITVGKGRTSSRGFSVTSDGAFRIEADIEADNLGPGAHATLVQIDWKDNGFSFFLRDVNSSRPIVIPEYGVAVLPARDGRSYAEVLREVESRRLSGGLAALANEPEETFEAACARNRSLVCPTWLGLSRDVRMFRLGYSRERGYWGDLTPAYHSVGQNAPETNLVPYSLGFAIGPGASCRVQIARRLEEGALPILRSEQREGDVTYHLTAFATLETQPLSPTNVRGTDWRAAYPCTGGNMLSKAESDAVQDLMDREVRHREEEVVCCIRVEAVNTGAVPRYAWFRSLHPSAAATLAPMDPATGMAAFESGRVFGVHRIDGRPVPQEEMAVLVQPGGKVTYDMLVPHQPISKARARKLARMNIDEHLEACRQFWRAKLDTVARIVIPEKSIDERIRAGLLHCDIAALGKEPDGNVLATIGWYAPIGSESAPIIQFFDSMGWHALAERSLNFFLDRQREDGFIQNFGGYQLETGPALWSMGEHYRYTRDKQWVERIKPRLLKSCRFLLDWRNRNKQEALRGRGYGLQDGKVADPNDFYHSFMLNALSYIGLQRVAEMLKDIGAPEAANLAREANAYRKDIRTAFHESMARSPVIPTGDGCWVPSFPPWAEYRGPVALYADGGTWSTHGAFAARDSLIGSLHLILAEVLDPNELDATFMLRAHYELMTVENAGLSQPYYVRHDYAHLRRGEVKAFLKMYYNQFTALQDRETYTFWEHYFHASQHKTHEEGWFLMQTRWMLWMEDGRILRLLPAIPRAWLADGQRIELKDVASYFGKINLRVDSDLSRRRITAHIECLGNRKPSSIELRLPHPEQRRAVAVEGGLYDPASETVRIARWNGKTTVTLLF